MDLYVILGLDQGASVRDVKRAYRRLARKYHPDINPGDNAAEAIFRQVVAAYETLSDPDRRRRYDTQPGDVSPEQATYQFEGFDFSAGREGASAATFGDLFADVLRRETEAAQRPERGADLHIRLKLTFDQAMVGGQWAVSVTRLETCHACQGIGQLPAMDARCHACQGSGSIRWSRGHMIFSKSCAVCEGTGRQRMRSCATCAREGVLARTETVHVAVPPGIGDGGEIRMSRKGHTGRLGGAAGDLYVAVDVAAHHLFRREGDDLHFTVPIAIHEAALGAKIDVPTIDGPTKMRVPAGTQSGHCFRLRGRGAPSPRGGRRGDLLVTARIVLPPVIDERSKELLREFGRLQREDVRQNWAGSSYESAQRNNGRPSTEAARDGAGVPEPARGFRPEDVRDTGH